MVAGFRLELPNLHVLRLHGLHGHGTTAILKLIVDSIDCGGNFWKPTNDTTYFICFWGVLKMFLVDPQTPKPPNPYIIYIGVNTKMVVHDLDDDWGVPQF